MPYDEYLGERISRIMSESGKSYFSKKMMGGLVFMVNEKMCCGIHIDKKYGDSLLMLRVGEEKYQMEIHKKVCLPMDFTGRVMRGYLFVTPEGFDLDDDLEYWIKLALEYNVELLKHS